MSDEFVVVVGDLTPVKLACVKMALIFSRIDI